MNDFVKQFILVLSPMFPPRVSFPVFDSKRFGVETEMIAKETNAFPSPTENCNLRNFASDIKAKTLTHINNAKVKDSKLI